MHKTDVLVVGSGMTGLVAALAAARRGNSVRLVSRGLGSISVSGGSIDVLGYVDGTPVEGDPIEAIEALPANHPYRLIGAAGVRESLEFVSTLLADNGLPFTRDANGHTLWVPTVVGTFRPTWLSGIGAGLAALKKARGILVVGIEGIKDCHAGMTLMELQKNTELSGIPLTKAVLPNPLGSPHRNTTPLDVARFMDSAEGCSWLARHLAPHKVLGGVAVLPPILGVDTHTTLVERLQATTGMELVEMASLPPGVGGERMQRVLRRLLQENGVALIENTSITGAEVNGTRCIALEAAGPDKKRLLPATRFIIATGGLLGGGISTEPGVARESIFNLPINTPSDVAAWSEPDIFTTQPYSRLGVTVNSQLQPLDPNGKVLLENVHFAGRTLAGYDFVTEKSGHGVAVASGFHAAQQCSRTDEKGTRHE